jgi:heavy metal translocating P-type ATPase
VDESAITGEATPVEKGVGDRLLGGTRVDGGGFRVRAERTGPDSTLGQMTAIVEAALDRKAAMEGLTDRLLRGFVPVIVLLAVGTGAACRLAGLGTEAALLRAITVMVISCPCALGIAIPLARVAGISLAGRKGILVQAFQAFETAGRLGHVVFDKTGTLTRGRWELLRVEALEGGPVEDLLALAAGVEAGIDHPVARAVGRAAAARGIRPAGCTGVERLETGVAATCGGRRLRIGSAACLGGWLDPAAPAGRRGGEAEGLLASRVYLGIDGRTAGVLVFGDRLKEAAADTVARLRSRGLAVSLVSGDGEAATRAASRVLGIDDAVGGRLPAEKAAIVAALRGGGGRKVAMVGDGMNDGPALAASDLGVALYGGAHLGREAAEVTLMRGDPRQLLEFLELAAAVHRKVVQNLALTFAYNLVAIPVAMSGLLSPLVAVTAMLLSSLSVTGNTLWLVRRGR